MIARTQRRDGFTLIELLVVILIVLVLAGLLIGSFGVARGAWKRSQTLAEIGAIETALTNFHADNGFYPAAAFIPIDTSVTPNNYKPDPRVEDADSEYKKSSRSLFLALFGRTQFNYNKANNEEALKANAQCYLKTFKALQVGDLDEDGGPLDATVQETYLIVPGVTADKDKFLRGSYLKDSFGNPYGYYFNPDAVAAGKGREAIKALYNKTVPDLWSTGGERAGAAHSIERWVDNWTQRK